VRLPMGTTYSRKKSARRSIIPISIRNGEIFPVDYHGSAHINAYISADGMVSIGSGVTNLAKGELQDVRLL
ncbi:MAG: hypothetical protein V1733_08040, partial [bacterium]